MGQTGLNITSTCWLYPKIAFAEVDHQVSDASMTRCSDRGLSLWMRWRRNLRHDGKGHVELLEGKNRPVFYHMSRSGWVAVECAPARQRIYGATQAFGAV